ncbi:non-ribosomal peptide synthetase [Cellulomonas palmilytica]|uniref:non-ribosomal peptide synthetase n=1 Tax=Cellulomonas palmilytica TaxID=2608402 RepID=UPI001F1918E8|nr:amino acid adenylation domain-containing protein [Cellulomonas palmilytica]UJP40453.1 amino acid adenylation domain-containing protein [Cellulomonas palmilytica]
MTVTSRYPATPAQRGMFLHHAANPTDTAFDLAFVFRIEEPVDLDLLVEATRAVFTAAVGASTSFEHGTDGVTAVVRPGSAVVRVVELPPDPVADQDRDARIALETEAIVASGPIPPGASEQLTVRVYPGDGVHHLTLVASHLVGDAYSFYRTVDAISTLYTLPTEAWPQVLDGLRDHPGTVPPTPTSPGAVARYGELLATADDLRHAELEPRRGEGPVTGTHHRWSPDPATAARIRASETWTEHGAATTFFTAYAATLQRLAGRETVALGVPLAGRAGHRAKNAIGFFVNTLPLPVRIDATTTWRELAAQVRSGIRLLQANQGLDLSGPDGADLLGGTFHGVDNAVTFYKQNLVLQLPGTRVTSVPLRRDALPYPLTVTASDDGERMELDVAVADHLEAADAPGLLRAALDALTRTPDAPVVRDVVLVDADEPPAPAAAPTRRTVVDDLEDVAQRTPHAVALRAGGVDVDYATLVGRVRATAAALDAAGASPFVVVTLPRSVEAVVAMLGVMASGRTYVPVDPAAPPRRAELIHARVARELDGRVTVLAEPGAQHVLAQRPDVHLLDGHAVTRGDGTGLPRTLRRGTDLAYVIFTSGSTGEPKGVVVRHDNVTALLDAALDAVPHEPSDRWCLFHSLAFDFSVWEVLGPLTRGGCLVVPQGDEVANPQAFAAFLARERVTVLNQTPSAFRRLSDVLVRAGTTLPDVRLAVFGGEALYPQDLRPWLDHVGAGTRFVNMYGITETTVHVTAREITPVEARTQGRSLVGEPLAHLGAVVVDPFGRLCPPGVSGELLVTGAGLAQGYLGRPDLTAERFRTVVVDGRRERAYVTGDRVRRDGDGELVYVGRVDDQVQLRGYRIELGEVTSALTADAGVGAAVVRLLEPAGTEPFLAAWVVPAPGGTLDDEAVSALRRALGERLPAYMVPAAIVPVPAIPTNQNGKPDLDRLPAPTAGPAAHASAPADGDDEDDDLAHRIARVWQDVIGAGRVRPHDRFMDVGGTSMHVMQVHERLRTGLGLVDVTLVDLFEHATPAELADFVLSRADR